MPGARSSVRVRVDSDRSNEHGTRAPATLVLAGEFWSAQLGHPGESRPVLTAVNRTTVPSSSLPPHPRLDRPQKVRGSSPLSVDEQHELAADVLGLAQSVRLRDLLERERLGYRNREATSVDQRADLVERVPRTF